MKCAGTLLLPLRPLMDRPNDAPVWVGAEGRLLLQCTVRSVLRGAMRAQRMLHRMAHAQHSVGACGMGCRARGPRVSGGARVLEAREAWWCRGGTLSGGKVLPASAVAACRPVRACTHRRDLTMGLPSCS